jgi:translation elongation factor EF-Tu-like GTPase
MPIESVFVVNSSEIAASGEIEFGDIQTGVTVETVGLKDSSTPSRVVGIEKFESGTSVAQAAAGDKVVLHLSEIDATAVQPGMVVAASNTIQAHKKLEAICFIPNEEKAAFNDVLTHGTPQECHFWTAVVTGVFTLKKGTKVEFPGGPGGFALVSAELSLPVATKGGIEFTMGADGKITGQVIGFPK